MTSPRPLDFWLRLVDDLIHERFRAALEEHGVTQRQWEMFNLLSAGAATGADLDTALAPFLPLSEPMSSSVEELAELVDSGWLTEEDRTYALTDQGRLVHGRLEDAWARRNTDLVRGISAAEVSLLTNMLERLARNLGWRETLATVGAPEGEGLGRPGKGSDGFRVELLDASPQPAAVIRGHARTDEVVGFLGSAFSEVLGVLREQQQAPTGPPFGRYVPDSTGGFDIVAGFPSTGDIAPAGRVEPDGLPGGTIASVLYRGDYAGVGGAYEALMAWTSRHGYVPSGPPWESYLDTPDVAEPRTLVQLPCQLSGTGGPETEGTDVAT